MATAANDASGATPLVDHRSPDNASVVNHPDIPPITQDEVIAAGKTAPVEEKTKKRATPDPGMPECPPGTCLTCEFAAKKRKTKKKTPVLPPPFPPPSQEARYYYDIKNLIVTNGADLEQFGIRPINSSPVEESVPAPPVQNLARKQIPVPWRTLRTKEGTTVAFNATFCPDCGMRVWKHGEEVEHNNDGSMNITIICPDD